ncbi:hypothetical protein HDU88_001521 [Geranomyces variabilis]|nr:hypothetical protein HDU88_001521 [Geranomyces variabilis]
MNKSFEKLLNEAQQNTSEFERKKEELKRRKQAEEDAERRRRERDEQRQREIKESMLAASRATVMPPSRRTSTASMTRDTPPPSARPASSLRLEVSDSQSRRLAKAGNASSGANATSKRPVSGMIKCEKKKTGGGHKDDFLSLMKEAEKITQQSTPATLKSAPAKRSVSAESERPVAASLPPKVRRNDSEGRPPSKPVRPGEFPPPTQRLSTSSSLSGKTPAARKSAEPPVKRAKPMSPRAQFELEDSIPVKKSTKKLDPRTQFALAAGGELPPRAAASRPSSGRPDPPAKFTKPSDRKVNPGETARSNIKPSSAVSAAGQKDTAEQRERAMKRKRESEREHEESERRGQKRRRDSDSDERSRTSTRGTRRDVDPFAQDEDDMQDIGSMIWKIMGKDKSKYVGRDDFDDSDMEADTRSIRREESRSARLARLEDQKEAAAEEEAERRRREAKRKGKR